ncbi:FHA domain-containing protein [Thermomonas sp.]|uniref:FHA domain-containing protein n=1 Tax=Thermomonas sp. TaxID=1971895 RepID=UPI002B81792B|nr:FHA domain-containing protein [Thermomonas sp.]HRO62189.1 FHA domain-containing protein [Thermomonas sp.]
MPGQVKRIGLLIGEFKRRGVFKAVAAYAVIAWGASLAATDLLPAFGAPGWTVRAFIICAALGLPVVAVLAWLYEITTRGIVRDTGVSEIPAAPQDGNTTVAFVGAGVRVRWKDAGGEHERSFFRDFAIGREAPCELILDDPHISRRHVEVRHEQGRWWLVDPGSRNGTRLDGELVQRAPLPASASVRLYDAGPELRMETTGETATITAFGMPQ